MRYFQIASYERSTIATMLWRGFWNAAIARALGRHRRIIGGEVKRNLCNDGAYRAERAETGAGAADPAKVETSPKPS
jgi:IS30 family transposase